MVIRGSKRGPPHRATGQQDLSLCSPTLLVTLSICDWFLSKTLDLISTWTLIWGIARLTINGLVPILQSILLQRMILCLCIKKRLVTAYWTISRNPEEHAKRRRVWASVVPGLRSNQFGADKIINCSDPYAVFDNLHTMGRKYFKRTAKYFAHVSNVLESLRQPGPTQEKVCRTISIKEINLYETAPASRCWQGMFGQIGCMALPDAWVWTVFPQ